MGISDRNGDERCSDHAECVALDESARSPVALQIGANEPKRQHVKEHMAEAHVEQGIGDNLPEPAVLQHIARNQRQPFLHLGNDARVEAKGNDLEQVNPGACQDDALHPSGKGREAERNSLSAAHSMILSVNDLIFDDLSLTILF